MIKPLFPDGFVNDSDSESLSEELSEDDASMDLTAGTTSTATTYGVPGDNDAQGQKERRKKNVSGQGRQSRQEDSTSSTISSNPGLAGIDEDHSSLREKTVPLSQLLTNVVILEEVVKEVVAMAQVRRGLGVDKVRFL
jgi:hypothetical protein